MKPAWIHSNAWLLTGVLWWAAAGMAVAQSSPDAASIAKQGNGRGAPPCMACHGVDGGGQDAAGFPRLAGLNAAYLERQLDSFAEGSRVDPTMSPVAKALTEDERKALAEYYSKLPIPAAAARGAATPPDDPLGKKLAERGRWSEQVPGCVQCHGPHGVGVGEHFPPLAGQPAAYIAKQLHAWKQGKRSNDPLDLMKHVASALNDKDIQAVSTWFAVQPAKLEGGKR